MDEQEIYSCAVSWIKEGGEIIRSALQNPLIVEEKSNPNDLVTNIDKEIERFFVEKIKGKFPNHRILGEEGNGDKINNMDGVVWIIDPIDGTTNFIHQHLNFAISVGIYEDGVGKLGFIYDVIHNELFYARKNHGAFLNDKKLPTLKSTNIDKAIIGLNANWIVNNERIDSNVLIPLVQNVRGTRSYGSAAIEIAYVAAGRLDAYISLRLSPWDFAAGNIIINEVGGVLKTLRGESINLLRESSVFVTKPGLYDEIFEKYLQLGKW